MATAATDLAQKMRARAGVDALPADHKLRVLADSFDAAAKGFYANPQTVKAPAFFAEWARARRAWCAYSGEPLL
jgi:hypothetical protein